MPGIGVGRGRHRLDRDGNFTDERIHRRTGVGFDARLNLAAEEQQLLLARLLPDDVVAALAAEPAIALLAALLTVTSLR